MAQRCYVVYIGRVPGVYEQWQDCQMQVNGFSGNSYKGYKSRAVAEARWRNHLKNQNRNRMKTYIVVLPVLLTAVIAVLVYLMVV